MATSSRETPERLARTSSTCTCRLGASAPQSSVTSPVVGMSRRIGRLFSASPRRVAMSGPLSRTSTGMVAGAPDDR